MFDVCLRNHHANVSHQNLNFSLGEHALEPPQHCLLLYCHNLLQMVVDAPTPT